MVSGGVAIPTLVLGALLGRMYGLVLNSWIASWGYATDYLDPGLLAFLGSAAFYAGVSRLTMRRLNNNILEMGDNALIT